MPHKVDQQLTERGMNMLKIEVKQTVKDTSTNEPVKELSLQASTLSLLIIFLPIVVLLSVPKVLVQSFNFNNQSGIPSKKAGNQHGKNRTKTNLQNV